MVLGATQHDRMRPVRTAGTGLRLRRSAFPDLQRYVLHVQRQRGIPAAGMRQQTIQDARTLYPGAEQLT